MCSFVLSWHRVTYLVGFCSKDAIVLDFSIYVVVFINTLGPHHVPVKFLKAGHSAMFLSSISHEDCDLLIFAYFRAEVLKFLNWKSFDFRTIDIHAKCLKLLTRFVFVGEVIEIGIYEGQWQPILRPLNQSTRANSSLEDTLDQKARPGHTIRCVSLLAPPLCSWSWDIVVMPKNKVSWNKPLSFTWDTTWV